MDLKQFKQKGLKSGDRVEIITAEGDDTYIAQWEYIGEENGQYCWRKPGPKEDFTPRGRSIGVSEMKFNKDFLKNIIDIIPFYEERVKEVKGKKDKNMPKKLFGTPEDIKIAKRILGIDDDNVEEKKVGCLSETPKQRQEKREILEGMMEEGRVRMFNDDKGKEEEVEKKIDQWNASELRKKDKAAADILKNGYKTTYINEEKPIKFLSTLELGDEVEIDNFLSILGILLQSFDHNKINWDYLRDKAKKLGIEDWIKWPDIAQKDSSIIDEIIDYFEGLLFHVNVWLEKDNSWMPQVKKINKFITYFKEHKNQ